MSPEERLIDVETRLVAQEHRLFTILQNFFVERPKWPTGDPRRDAAAKALIWSLFFSPGTVAVAGSLIGLATLAVLVWQNTLIVEQNTYFREQISQQQRQIQDQNRVSLQNDRSRAIEVIYGPNFTKNPRVKAEAVRTLVVIERSLIANEENVFESNYVNLHDANLAEIHIENFDLRNVSFRNANLRQAVLAGIDMTGSAFRFAKLEQANFYNSDLSNTFWDSANLTTADFQNADLNGANMVRADLRFANFDGVQNWRTIAITDAKIYGMQNAPDGFQEWAEQNGADPRSGQ
ncbi:pentapeptide repeat-containing protein [Shimia abyssi]|uniref:Pentapeptide repeat protein n=1 Tax=Shimia abyssi TaxID=1662395 RepID=A0A2P8FJX1_9RHOB|nr:pentapeptide repeat-containing protein [Shimia abyssi]PSL22017.1 pentapeptide repeat protein [Shimia abyssi]